MKPRAVKAWILICVYCERDIRLDSWGEAWEHIDTGSQWCDYLSTSEAMKHEEGHPRTARPAEMQIEWPIRTTVITNEKQV